MEYLEGCLIARPAELPRELHRRHARRLAGNQGRRPKPYRQRRMRAIPDGAGSEARVAVAMTTPENAGAIGKAVRLTGRATVVTDEPITPPSALKVGRACRFVREPSLKLWQRARERPIASVKHVDNHGRPRLAQMLHILPVVRLGDNRISTLHRSPIKETSRVRHLRKTKLRGKLSTWRASKTPSRRRGGWWKTAQKATLARLALLLAVRPVEFRRPGFAARRARRLRG